LSADLPMAEMAWREIVALHTFFETWFRTDGGISDFIDCERALAPDFSMVGPDGVIHRRDDVIGRLRRTRGTHPADFRIDVLDRGAIWTREDAVLLGYTEQQYCGGRTNARRSTALFLSSKGAPRGVVWCYLHETWIEAPRG
jgi:hypothetical protein